MRGAKRKELVIKLIFKHFELGPESARGYRCTKAHNINFNATEKQQSSYIHPNSCQITCLHFNQGCGNCIGSERNIYTVDYTDCACYGNEVWNIPCLVLRFFFLFSFFILCCSAQIYSEHCFLPIHIGTYIVTYILLYWSIFLYSPTTTMSPCAVTVWNDGASADTSHRYRPLDAKFTESNTTKLSVELCSYI